MTCKIFISSLFASTLALSCMVYSDQSGGNSSRDEDYIQLLEKQNSLLRGKVETSKGSPNTTKEPAEEIDSPAQESQKPIPIEQNYGSKYHKTATRKKLLSRLLFSEYDISYKDLGAMFYGLETLTCLASAERNVMFKSEGDTVPLACAPFGDRSLTE